jgi:hypothetical protein
MNEMTKTILEKLSDEVDFTITPNGRLWLATENDGDFIDPDFRTSAPLADLLEQKMVDDGWNVRIEHYAVGFYANVWWYEPFEGVPLIELKNTSATRPAALCELFCRVYSIPMDGKE